MLRGVGRLAAALRAAAAAGGHGGPSHLDGFVSNDRRELFTPQRAERDRQASGVRASASELPVTAAVSATNAAAAAVSITISISISYGRISHGTYIDINIMEATMSDKVFFRCAE